MELHAPFSTAGNGSCHQNLGRASPKYLKEYPAKRTGESEDQAIQAGSGARVGLFKRNRGCLSELSALSLENLSEIFCYLYPSDLLSLSRVNKYFRSFLLSYNSSMLWNTCFKLCSAPASPAEVSPQAWAHLLFGGAYCYSCGAKPEDNILFSLRRRACKSCMAAHLLCSSDVPQGFRDMIRFEIGCMGHQQMPCCTRHWWDEDVAAFEAELNILKYPVGASEGGIAGVRANALTFLTRKKEEVRAIREHALICAEWDKDRIASGSSKSSAARVKRFEDIKAPFLQLGYSESDVDQSRRHRGVRVGMPMPDRVWQRVDPPLRPGANEVRDRRIVMQVSSHWQDHVALLDATGSAGSSDQLPTGSRLEERDPPGYRLASGRALQGNDSPDYGRSQFFMRANSQDHVTQPNASSYQSPIGGAPEASASKYSTLADALLLSDPDDQVDVQSDEATASILPECPVCRDTFRRVQERNRHVELYLPHSILCPFLGCTWTGRRQWDFKEHWKKTHSNSGRVPVKANGIYDPKKFVKSIVDGTPLVEVVQSACSTVQERLWKLGKAGVGVNVWGRKRKVDN